MRRFSCPSCGSEVFFDSTHCEVCDTQIGFRLETLEFRAISDPDAFACVNYAEHGVCNWLAQSSGALCSACDRNAVIPSLKSHRNILLWARMETAKRRLIYGLFCAGLPVGPMGDHPGLSFRFMEDQRTDPDVLEDFIATGHVAGTITVNLAEADDAVRAERRQRMNERYRTLLGHLRHEAGHYYFTVLVESDPTALAEFRALFGDETQNYEAALGGYYASKPSDGEWESSHVSRYASAHPHEDWAETWAHFLHIEEALETAAAWGLTTPAGEDWLTQWMNVAVVINELNRSLGVDDAYPFVITPKIAAKLQFIGRRVAPYRRQVLASAAVRQTHA